ncbi:MAG TPA: hypothetical protein DER60_03585 [Syntrophomonas sp.]|nr:hypothetical protein [Syntrophomonas sp.]
MTPAQKWRSGCPYILVFHIYSAHLLFPRAKTNGRPGRERMMRGGIRMIYIEDENIGMETTRQRGGLGGV